MDSAGPCTAREPEQRTTRAVNGPTLLAPSPPARLHNLSARSISDSPSNDHVGDTETDKGKVDEVASSKEAVADVPEPSPPKKKRRRAILSCAECRRLKLKCDRQVPCDQCKKRGCAFCCPNDIYGANQKRDMDSLIERNAQLEELVRAHGLLPAQPRPPHDRFLAGMAPPVAASTSRSASTHGQFEATDGASSSDDNDDETGIERSFGTLVLEEGGGQKWVGPHARSEWLLEGSGEEGMATPMTTDVQGTPGQAWRDAGHAFPFRNVPICTIGQVLNHVPPRSEARLFIDSYLRYADYNYTPVRWTTLARYVDEVYAAVDDRSINIHPHRLALFFQVLATGCQFNLELSLNDPLSDLYQSISQCCLTLEHFLDRPTLAACQTLQILGNYLLTKNPRSGGDRSWPVWGMAMRCCLAMGLHRDPSRFGLSPTEIDERRLIFWEIHVCDTLQSFCGSRPNSLQPGTYDAEFPVDEDAIRLGQPVGFGTIKYQLVEIVNKMLAQVMNVSAAPTTFKTVTKLWHTLCDFEKTQIPYFWRCRPAWKELVSVSGSAEDGVRASPEINKLDLRLNFQRHTLALNVADAVMFLQRPYFAKALHQRPDDPCQSKYASSFLAVFERCLVMIRVCESLSLHYPAPTLRQWFLWYHTFTAAVCMSTIAILAPRCPFADYALRELEGVVRLFASAPEGSRPRATLPALLKLHQRAQGRLTADVHPFSGMGHAFGVDLGDLSKTKGEEDQNHLALLGWSTRLVKSLRSQRDAQGDLAPAGEIAHLPDLPMAPQALPNGSVGVFHLTGGEQPRLSFPLPPDLMTTNSLMPDAQDVVDYNAMAQFNDFMLSNVGTGDHVEWDGLAAMFGMPDALKGPGAGQNSSGQPPL